MSAKQFYHDIELMDVGQLLRARLHNVDNAAESTLAGTLGADHEGLIVYNTESDQIKTWDGSQFNAIAPAVQGDIIFKGEIDGSVAIDDAGQPQAVEPVAGYQYVVTTAGTFAAGSTGVTLTGNQDLEVGDIVLFTGTDSAVAFQRNDALATEVDPGNIRLATQAEAGAGTNGNKAITPATLSGVLQTQQFTKQFSDSVDLSALTPLTVNHGLNLTGRDSFVVNCMHGNSQVSLDVDSTDANNITLTSLVPLTGVQVTVIGASAA